MSHESLGVKCFGTGEERRSRDDNNPEERRHRENDRNDAASLLEEEVGQDRDENGRAGRVKG